MYRNIIVTTLTLEIEAKIQQFACVFGQE